MNIPWHGQDVGGGGTQGSRQVPSARPQPQTTEMLQGTAALGTGSPFPAKKPFSREGKWSTEAGAMHPLAQSNKAHGPLSIGVAVLPQGAGRGASSSSGKSPHLLH